MHDFNYPNIAGIAAAPKPQGPGWRRGLTLIEMMVATLIMVVVAAAAFSLFKLSATYERHQQELMTQTQNLRAALYAISRDVRMAGSGIPMIGSSVVHIYVDDSLVDPDIQNTGLGNGWFTYAGATETGVRAIYGNNSGRVDEDRSDSLTIFRSELESTFSLGRLSTDFTPGSSDTLSLQEDVIVESTFTSGNILAISDGLKTVIVQATTTAGKGNGVQTLDIGPKFEPQRGLPDGHIFQSGSQVYNLRDVTFVTYYVDTANNRLMADYHDITLRDEDADDSARPHLVTVADNIEDFQVSYHLKLLSSQNLVATADIDWENFKNGAVVKAVDVALVSRSQKPSRVSTSNKPIEVMGHTAKGAAKNDEAYTRRIMSETITLRNF